MIFDIVNIALLFLLSVYVNVSFKLIVDCLKNGLVMHKKIKDIADYHARRLDILESIQSNDDSKVE